MDFYVPSEGGHLLSDYNDMNSSYGSQPPRRRRMDKYSNSEKMPAAADKAPGSVPTGAVPPPAQTPIIGENSDVPATDAPASYYPSQAPVYDNANVGEQRRRALQRPPQSTDVYTRMTQTGYQQTVRQQARSPYAPQATPGAQYAPQNVGAEPRPRPRVLEAEQDAPEPSGRRGARRPERDEAYEQRMARKAEMNYDDENDEPPRRHVGRTILLIVLFLIVLCVGVYFLLPAGDTGIIGKLNQVKSKVTGVVDQVKYMISPTQTPAQALEFKCATTTGTTGCKSLFYLTTTQNVSGVRLVDEWGDEVVSTVTKTNAENETNRVWEITVVFDQPYSGAVFAAIKQGDEWTTTDKSLMLSFAEPASTPQPTLTPVPEATPSPDEGKTGANEAVQAAAILPSDTPPSTVFVIPTTPEPVVQTEAPTEEPLEEPVEELTEESIEAETEAPTEEPTEEPTEAPTQEPTATPVPTQTPAPTATPMPSLTASGDLSSLKMTDTVYSGAKALSDFARATSLAAVSPSNYMYWDGGVLTFRGDSFRRNAAFGTVEVSKDQLSVAWQKELGSIRTADNGTLYGVGWTGQPAIVKWSKEIREMMNINDEKKSVKALKEVIFSAQDGKVYFVDLTDGQDTREPISIGYPLKGSVSVDAMGRPMISFGQGISKLAGGKQGKIGFYLYNLIDCSQLMFINGRSSNSQKQYGSNGAFDGTSLMLWNSDAMVVAGENGLLYTVELNTDFKLETKALTVNPTTVYLKSKANAAKESQTSIESSVAMYDKYVFMADSYGALRCVNTDTMRTVWALDAGDNTDSSIALDFDESGNLWLYTGNTNFARLGSKKDVSIRRINAMTGEIDWTYSVKCAQDKKTEQAGCKASPVIGENSIVDLAVFTVNKVSDGGSMIVALKKATGEVAWSYNLDAEAISSPVAVYNEAGDAWIIQGDMNGTLHMLDGRSGAHLSELALGGEIQGSPAVYKDILVVGTCDKGNANMYGIRIE